MQARQTYSVSATAARLGVAPATLRTWARRHGMEPSVHATGAHRRYTELDLLKLMTMRTLIIRGALVSEAAQAASNMNFDGVTVQQVESELARELEASGGAGTTSGADGVAENGPESSLISQRNRAEIPQENAPVAVLRIAPDPGDADDHSVEETDSYKARCTTLVSAALKDDIAGCMDLLAIRTDESFVDWWKLLVKPALDRISNHTVLATPGKTPRLLLGYFAQRAIADRLAVVRPDVVAHERPHPSRLKNITLVFAPEGDDLAIPAHALTGALLESGCNAHVILGPENERRVGELVKIVRPSVIAFVSHQVAPDLDLLRYVAEEYPDLPIFVWLREGEDIGDVRSLPHVVSMSSFRAMFHEIHGSVRSLDPSADYWPEGQAEYLSK